MSYSKGQKDQNITSSMFSRLEEHAAKQLVQSERTKLPRTQEALDARYRCEVIKSDMAAASEKIREAQLEVAKCREEFEVLRDEYDDQRYRSSIDYLVNESEDQFQNKLVTHCPMDECRGFARRASTSEKNAICSLCDACVCMECGVCIREKTDIATHVCKEEDVANFALVNLGSQPCPSCHVLTYKSNGCNEMFCTHCHTPWNWDTGKIILSRTRLHNPHYIDFQRTNVDEMPTRNGATCADGLAVPWMTSRQLNESVNALVDGKMRLPPIAGSIVLAFSKLLYEVEQFTMQNLRPEENKRRALATLRLKYLQKTLSDEKWLSSVKRILSKEKRELELFNLWSAFVHSCHDQMEIVLFENDPQVRLDAVWGLIGISDWFNTSSSKLHNAKYKPRLVPYERCKVTKDLDLFKTLLMDECKTENETRSEKVVTFVHDRSAKLHPHVGDLFITIDRLEAF